MAWVDADSDADTFNSSTATLSLPAGASVTFAGLYWGADTERRLNPNGGAARRGARHARSPRRRRR